jgi:uncharacterized membrane protein
VNAIVDTVSLVELNMLHVLWIIFVLFIVLPMAIWGASKLIGDSEEVERLRKIHGL